MNFVKKCAIVFEETTNPNLVVAQNYAPVDIPALQESSLPILGVPPGVSFVLRAFVIRRPRAQKDTRMGPRAS